MLIPADEAGAHDSRLIRTFAALRHPNYRLWFFGQMASVFGTWMQSTAQGFLIYDLTHSPAYLGYAGFAGGISVWIFMLYGGVVTDRVPRRALLVLTQSVMMLLALVLSLLTFLRLVTPWHILILAFLLGVANAFDAPARQSFVLELVQREDLTNAIALNSTLFNTAQAVGPAFGGLTYAALGPGWCFLLNGLSFLAIIVPLTRMRLPRISIAENKVSAFNSLKEGLSFIKGNSFIPLLIALVMVFGLFGVSMTALFPAWAVRILGGDARTNGLLQSARGLGALIGALFIASLGRFRYKGRLLSIGSFVFPVTLALFACAHHLALSLFMLLILGFSQIQVFNLANAMVQTLTADALRGRVMSVYALTFFGFMPLGALLAGSVAERAGLTTAVLMGAAACLLFSLLLRLLFPRISRLE